MNLWRMLLTSSVTHRCLFIIYQADFYYAYKSRQFVPTNASSIVCYHLPAPIRSRTRKYQQMQSWLSSMKLGMLMEDLPSSYQVLHIHISVILHLSFFVSSLFLPHSYYLYSIWT